MGFCSACNAPVDEGVEKCANCAGGSEEGGDMAPAVAPVESEDESAA
ncbi:MAG: hypothetical protein AAB570_03070 [Patescibacteria group bacterium]